VHINFVYDSDTVGAGLPAMFLTIFETL
jgi:hypothetical protein